MKNIKTALKLAAGYFLRKRSPLSVTFITTYRCNFRCKYCSVWEKKSDELSTEEVFKMIDELCVLGMRRLGLNGGEPLLREDIGEIINYARSKDITTTLFSNGWLVRENISKLKKVNVLIISLDGPPEAHDLQRQPGSYDRAIEAIESARGKGLNVWTNTVVSKNNLDKVDFVLEKAKKYGFKTTFQPVFFYAHSSRKEDIEQLSVVPDKYIAVIDKLIQEKKRGGPVVHSLKYLEYIKNPDWIKNKRRCWAGRFYFAVTPEGRIAPCYPIFASCKWPSGKDTGFKKAIDSIGSYSCGGCYCILAENDFFFSLHPEVVWNTFKYVK